ncbi:MAG TPA: aldehyde dehydrogenase family protein [Rhizomicrobium sp.]|jgi:aldehyde dehydrogenase (NAD+)|nr:aldehyde dehydrogenase family protein [Rhizomicrobium sp.]
MNDLLAHFGIKPSGDHAIRSPIDGAEIGRVAYDDVKSIEKKVGASVEAFKVWRNVPAPRRGELVRLLGEELRANKDALGKLVTLEAGKIVQEGLGEVQEMIDICDFAVGLSRQIYGLTIASERPGHRMMETWHPAGPVAVISAFNFPVAVWAWNAALALICGDSVIWKPSEKTPLTALATLALFERAAKKFGDAPANLSQVVLGVREAGEALAKDARIPVVSATGSTRMGRELSPVVAARFGKSILELGGNNGMIVTPSAKLDLAQRAIIFSAVGTAGQRCTSLRRLFVHDSIYDTLVPALKKTYANLPIGNPLEKGTLVGPLIDKHAYDGMERALASAKDEGGKVTGGNRVNEDKASGAYYVKPAIVEMPEQTATVAHETFAPILYVLRYKDFADVLRLHNAVPQGLSSCIFTTDMQEAEKFIAASGSDCGIANVNIGPSGAEIGGAFGGEKETGGGRESGSDSWKAYMRRQTATINYSDALPLAQGIEFEIAP